MPKYIWHVGIDEAGYGPNLGPLVMSLVACRAPRENLWELLRPAVRRADEDDDGRPVVADSKAVHTAGKGLKALESSVAPLLRSAHPPDDCPAVLAGLLEKIAAAYLAELRTECWFTGRTSLPVEAEEDALCRTTDKVRQTAQAARVALGLVRSAIVCPPRFNSLAERWDSKAAVLGLGLAELVSHCLALSGAEPFEIIVDKHGGRNSYSALVQHAFPEGMVLAREEGAERSYYEVRGLSRTVRVIFMPRAETASFCVALASMVSKYLRELFMVEFNQFWTSHLPGLKPTAGYPGDSERYFHAISPAMAKLGIGKEKIWRKR